MSSGNPRPSLLTLGFTAAGAPPLTVARWPVAGGVLGSATRPALGTRVAVTAVAGGGDQAQAAIATAFDELDRLAAIFSRYDPASAVSALNDAGWLLLPPPELRHVAARAITLHAATGGAFDVTVKPILDLLAGRLPATPPSGTELSDAAARVNARWMRVARGGIRFGRDGMGVSLDGIAKGYIVDRMAAVLERHRIRRFLIDAGGDIRARGRSPRGDAWLVGVRDPRGGPEFPDIIGLEDGAVATSGSYARCYGPTRAYHHIVSPRDGRSPQEVVSASVAAPDALTADALATAVLVLGADRGIRLIERLPRCAALVLDSNGLVRRSRRWVPLSAPPPEGIPS